MAPAPQQSQQPSSGGMGAVWIVVAIFIFAFLIWYFARAWLVTGYFYIKRFEIGVFEFFFPSPTLSKIHQYILDTAPYNVTFSELGNVANTVGVYLKFPIAVLLFLFAVFLYFRSSASQYRQTYNMGSLAQLESENWPQITPVLGLDLIKEDIEKGSWSMSMRPMDFAKKYKLLEEYRKPLEAGRLSKESTIAVNVLKDRATKLFTLQLGPQWKGLHSLKPHARALFAAFLAKAARDSKVSENFLRKIAASARKGSLDFSGTNELIRKHKDFKLAHEVINGHAYVLTVMASLLQLARTDGVLSSADFLWLKPIDRRLWFMLNSVGRQTAFVEIAGPFAHWLAELKMGRRLKTPMIEEATKALEAAIKEIEYNPDN